ncbi:DUF5810 domain-containing protein [Halococcus hamelinensis]|uniref:Uncharacterized protein n=1 Tax=Halococcus hamelinensis 100A6 TaxID=1132509 RepID=M0LWY6_9EURY|nr:DUF5810 domain-containing protein [Halococcus hamelinensis]EMA36605.1 hypothetical protein C447_15146 [Halococcus hamelinensis 100A6]
MGYACPVCETPQADAHHLANHLAFTALLGDDDHEAWLDEHTPGWDEAGEDELAERVVEAAKEVEFPQVFEDTTDDDHHDHDEPRPGELFDDEPPMAGSRGPGGGDLDAETAEALRKARELTRDDDESE